MGVYDTSGNRLTKTNFPKTTWNDPDPLLQVTAEVIVKKPFYGAEDPNLTEGTETEIKYQPGDLIRTSEFNALFPAADVTNVSPAVGPAAGGTVVTLTGVNLDGVTAVTFGGTAGTLGAITPTSIKVTTPAKTAGAVNVVLTDDSGTDTETGAFTFQ